MKEIHFLSLSDEYYFHYNKIKAKLFYLKTFTSDASIITGNF